MIRLATRDDRERVIEILTASFDSNPAVNDAISPGGNRAKKMRVLMGYLVDTGFSKEGVYITTDENGAFIMYDPVMHPDKLYDKFRQLKLVNSCIGWSRLNYATAKDRKMKSFRPATSHFYLSMIGTHPAAQGKGVGSLMLNHIMVLSAAGSKTVYLETSVKSNVEMYIKKSFVVHGEWKIRDDYHVHFMSWSK